MPLSGTARRYKPFLPGLQLWLRTCGRASVWALLPSVFKLEVPSSSLPVASTEITLLDVDDASYCQVPLNRDHTLPGAKEKKFAFVNFQVSMAAINVPKVTTSHLPTGTFVALSTSPSGYSRSVRNNLEVHCGTTMILYHHLNQCRGYEERKEER
jgi:hypothetical protein